MWFDAPRRNARRGTSCHTKELVINLPIDTPLARQFLLEKTPPELDLTDKSPVIEWVVERCGAWPFYLQVMGFELVEEHLAGRRGAFVNETDLNDLYEEKLLAAASMVFKSRWTDSPTALRRVLLQVQHGRLPALNDLAQSDRRVVRDCGLADFKGRWQHDPPFYRWIEDRREELSAEVQP